MRRFLLATLMLLCGAAGTPSGWAATIPPLPEQYLQDTWQREDGLPQISVLAIVQDPRGYLWLGTEDGLVRFDGVDFTVRDRESTPELRSSFVEVLLVDRHGSLWIGTYDGLTHLADGRFSLYTTADGLAHDHVQALHQDRAGRLWIGTAGGVSCLEAGRFRTYTTREGLSHDVVWAILEYRDGDLWIGTQGGLSRLSEGRFTTYHTPEGLSHDHVLALHEDRQGGIWIGTVNGLSRFEDGRFVVYTPEEGLAHPTVWTLHGDREGNVWVGTDGGLNRFHDGVFATFTTADGMPDNEVRAIWEDHEGSLWIGTRQGGLWRLREGRFTTLGRSEGLADDVVWTILQDRTGSVWIGTNQGLTRIAPDGATTTYTTRDGLPSSDVRSLCEDREGNLWAGTFAHGLARLRDGAFRIFTTGDGLPAPGVYAIAEDRQGALWVGTGGGGVSRLKDGRFTTFTTQDGLPDNSVRALYHDPAGVLWIGTEGGLARYQDGTFTAFGRQDGLADALITAIYGDRQGTLWLGTFDGGLSRLRDGEFTNFSTRDGLFDNRVFQILEDGRGRLWMTSNKGVSRVSKQELEDFARGRTPAITSVSYDESDGMRSSECNGGFHPAGWRTRDGRLWFPTIKGVAIIDGENPKINLVPPPVDIQEVLIDQRAIDPGRRAVFEPGTREFDFRYVALSYLVPEKNRFRYRLEGFHDDWVNAGRRRSVYFTNLAPGPYRFRVIATNNDGMWNETGDTFEFYLRPAFHQTWSFYAVCALASGFLVLGFHRFRVRQLLRRKQELAIQVEQRTAEILRTQAQLVQSEKMASLGQLVAGVAHEINNPVTFISSGLPSLRRDIDELIGLVSTREPAPNLDRIRRRVNKLLEAIEEGARRTAEIVKDLRAFSRLGEAELKIADLHQSLDSTLTLLHNQTKNRVRIIKNYGDVPAVECYVSELNQVFMNLLMNAVQAIDGEGTLTITTAMAGDEHVRISIRDTGRGMSQEVRRKMFDPFFTTKPVGEGTGLGLSISHGIIEKHGGVIAVESEPGRGTEVRITLPVRSSGAEVGLKPDILESGNKGDDLH